MAEQQQGDPPALHPPPLGLVPIQLPKINYQHLSTLVANQHVITKLMLSGLHVAKVDEISSANQPGLLDLNNDDEPPWEIDFSKSPDHTVNKEMVKQWVQDVLNSDNSELLVVKGKLKPEECTEHFV
ncbi:hypothetical protein FRC06_011281 [Ceratobasidium sp. 370]|nr:hypothetical protein FRC06_011281 [Ceratobasidium sp. 370]